MIENKQKPLSEMSSDELKILWFDQLELFEQLKVNLDLIRKEIQSKKGKV